MDRRVQRTVSVMSQDKDDDDLLDKYGLGGTARSETPSPTPTPLSSEIFRDIPSIIARHAAPAPAPANPTISSPFASAEEALGALTEELDKGPSSPFAKALQERLVKNRPVERKLPRPHRQQFQLGFNPIDIAPGTTVTVCAQVQRMFRGRKLFVFESDLGLQRSKTCL